MKRLLELEVHEIQDGTVEIKSVAREAGARSKIAVYSANSDVDCVGACVGPKGTRVQAIVNELRGEKIDIIEYSDEPEKFIAAALSPARVLSVEVDPEGAKSCRVTVPDAQLSLAIGNKGQNARLAAKLTGWKPGDPDTGRKPGEGKKPSEMSYSELAAFLAENPDAKLE